MAITPELKRNTEETKKLISQSALDNESKKRWNELLDFSLENCNGLTQEQKIQGIAELLLEHTRILAERAVKEKDEESQKAMEMISKKVDELTQVQTNQQSMMKGLHDNMEKLFQLTDMLKTTNERIGRLEAREDEDNRSQDTRINTVFTKTADDIGQIRTEIAAVRNDVATNQQIFLDKLDEYTQRLTDADKKQDERAEARFTKIEAQHDADHATLNKKLDDMAKEDKQYREQIQGQLVEITKTLKQDPDSWKGVVARLFTPRSVVILVIAIIIMFLLHPESLDSITGIWKKDKTPRPVQVQQQQDDIVGTPMPYTWPTSTTQHNK